MFSFIIEYIRNHWRGKQSLARSILLNTLALNSVYAVAYRVLEPRLIDESSTLNLFTILSTVIVTAVMMGVWQAVGTWRSVNRSIGEHGSNFGHRLIKAYVIVVASYTAFQIFDIGLVNYRLVEMELGLDRELSKFDVEVLSETELSLDGGITKKSVDAIKSELEKNEHVKILHLTSIGGYLVEANNLADAVRQYDLETYVSWECASACTSVFLASNYRSIGLEGILGFHSSDCPGIVVAKDECALTQTEEMNYLRSRGVAEWFIEKVNATKSDDLWEPNFQELSDGRVITHIFDGTNDIKAHRYCRENDCKALPIIESEDNEAEKADTLSE